jgi:hypothetical protein
MYRMSKPTICESVRNITPMHKRFVDVNIREQYEVGHAKLRAKHTRDHITTTRSTKGLLLNYDQHEQSRSSNIANTKRTNIALARERQQSPNSADQHYQMQSEPCDQSYNMRTYKIYEQDIQHQRQAQQQHTECITDAYSISKSNCHEQFPAVESSCYSHVAITQYNIA